jgi:hypothetical protein
VPRCLGDEGSVFAEFALVSPLLILLLLGIVEYGMAWREKANISSALRAAGRVGSSSTDINGNRSADLFAVQAFGTMMVKAKRITVNRFVIFKPDSTGAPTDASCLTTVPSGTGTGVDGACNIFSWAQVQAPGNNFTAPCNGSSGAAWDRFWCPTDRKINQDAPGGPPDYVGYYANTTYKAYTGLLPYTITLTDKFITRIDPKVTT